MDSWYKRVRNWFGSDSNASADGNADGAKSAMSAQMLISGVMTTQPNELDCNECFEQLDRFVEAKVTGDNAAKLMPMVQDHLNRCHDCCEEYEALLLALQANA